MALGPDPTSLHTRKPIASAFYIFIVFSCKFTFWKLHQMGLRPEINPFKIAVFISRFLSWNCTVHKQVTSVLGLPYPGVSEREEKRRRAEQSPTSKPHQEDGEETQETGGVIFPSLGFSSFYSATSRLKSRGWWPQSKGRVLMLALSVYAFVHVHDAPSVSVICSFRSSDESLGCSSLFTLSCHLPLMLPIRSGCQFPLFLMLPSELQLSMKHIIIYWTLCF